MLLGSSELSRVSADDTVNGSVVFRSPGIPIRMGRPNTISYSDISNFECVVARKLTSIIGMTSSIV